MGVDVCSEIGWSGGSSQGTSPRISFSHDLKGGEHVPLVSDSAPASATDFEFDFCVTAASHLFLDLSRPADELFYEGKILPVPMIEKHHDPQEHRSRSASVAPVVPVAEKKQLKELLLFDFDPEDEEIPVPPTKSFWSFSRSSSLNCDSLRSKGVMKSSQFLSRSNSTGSVLNGHDAIGRGHPNPKRSHPPCLGRRSVSSVVGVSVLPVLNFLPPVAMGNVGLSGIGSFFCSRNPTNNTKNKKKKKKKKKRK